MERTDSGGRQPVRGWSPGPALAAFHDGVTVICEISAQFGDAGGPRRRPARSGGSSTWRATCGASPTTSRSTSTTPRPAGCARLMARGVHPDTLARKLARQNAAELAALPDASGPEHIDAFACSARATRNASCPSGICRITSTGTSWSRWAGWPVPPARSGICTPGIWPGRRARTTGPPTRTCCSAAGWRGCRTCRRRVPARLPAGPEAGPADDAAPTAPALTDRSLPARATARRLRQPGLDSRGRGGGDGPRRDGRAGRARGPVARDAPCIRQDFAGQDFSRSGAVTLSGPAPAARRSRSPGARRAGRAAQARRRDVADGVRCRFRAGGLSGPGGRVRLPGRCRGDPGPGQRHRRDRRRVPGRPGQRGRRVPGQPPVGRADRRMPRRPSPTWSAGARTG